MCASVNTQDWQSGTGGCPHVTQPFCLDYNDDDDDAAGAPEDGDDDDDDGADWGQEDFSMLRFSSQQVIQVAQSCLQTCPRECFPWSCL